ncbi:MAG: hypothetical protein NZ908_02850, partial [Candidatus Micrarchaeota archaeon]|nr:hypothetical protein [Candidatus Micrarchaeota archaeon]
MKSLRHVDITMKYISEAKIYYREGISRPIHLVKPKDTINIQMSIGHEDAPNLNLSRREIERLIGQDELKRILKDLRDRGIHVIEHKHYNPNIQDERIYVPGNTWIPLSDTEYIFSSLYVLSKIYRELLLKIGIELSGEEQLFNPMFGYVGKVNDTDYYLVLPMFLDGEFVFKHNLSSNLNLRSVNHI